MKKFLGTMLITVMLALPMGVSATSQILNTEANYTENCQDIGSNQVKCQAKIKITNDNVKQLSFKLTPQNGAVISAVTAYENEDLETEWTPTVTNKGADGVWQVRIDYAKPNESASNWEGTAFYYIYTKSTDANANCRVGISFINTPNTPTPSPQTGSTLPYIALGAVVLLATGAYITTRNKSKMYRI